MLSILMDFNVHCQKMSQDIMLHNEILTCGTTSYYSMLTDNVHNLNYSTYFHLLEILCRSFQGCVWNGLLCCF